MLKNNLFYIGLVTNFKNKVNYEMINYNVNLPKILISFYIYLISLKIVFYHLTTKI